MAGLGLYCDDFFMKYIYKNKSTNECCQLFQRSMMNFKSFWSVQKFGFMKRSPVLLMVIWSSALITQFYFISYHNVLGCSEVSWLENKVYVS